MLAFFPFDVMNFTVTGLKLLACLDCALSQCRKKTSQFLLNFKLHRGKNSGSYWLRVVLWRTELYFGLHFDHKPMLGYTQSIAFIGYNSSDLLTIKARSLKNISRIKFLAVDTRRMLQAYYLSMFLPDHIFSLVYLHILSPFVAVIDIIITV